MRNIGTYGEPGDESIDPDDDFGCGDSSCPECGDSELTDFADEDLDDED